ncbi:NAD(P)/FAD-dependent oxidoreductase [Proteus myxofaciens]|uniref:NADH dehydrogenase n=1 Tax=Proteus myxofaciens ATCC 19692 TaxID=1354337 RepID=A0A198FIP5_9GAMM|nr:FAD-dependent oxidoreductase [Proteus myxofaciens]OAT24309.1 NADH dehydrogenase [Proteus myxofaciens ATCC 19692]
MTQKIVIAGSGFSGFWAAISAMRVIALAKKEHEIKVILISPKPNVTIRPRLYEAKLENMSPNISKQLEAVGVEYIAGKVKQIHSENHTLAVELVDNSQIQLAYDKFILATGSQLLTPPVTGFAEYGFNVDTLESAQQLETHLQSLKNKPETKARNTAVVVGGGLTGIESAAEMPDRLKAILGENTNIRVFIVDTAPSIAAGMGEAASQVVQQALKECGVETRASLRVERLERDSITLSNGECIPTDTVILATGVKAHPLTEQIKGNRDISGRIISDDYLHAPETPDVFVTGDTVKAATDDLGNYNLMTCQHALSLGRVAGYNAAAELIDIPLHAYRQPKYVTCLDLGPWGALYTEGWDRQVHFTQAEGKKIKQEINTQWIYPPELNREELFSIAKPDHVIVP